MSKIEEGVGFVLHGATSFCAKCDRPLMEDDRVVLLVTERTAEDASTRFVHERCSRADSPRISSEEKR